jgi:hypothetical protein
MLRLLITRVNGYLCLNPGEVRLARQHIDPAPRAPEPRIKPVDVDRGLRV